MRARSCSVGPASRGPRRSLLCAISLVLACGTVSGQDLTVPRTAEGTIDVRGLVDRVDRLLRGESSHGTATMTVKTRRWTRSLTMEMWSQGANRFLVRMLAPPREAGTATVKSGNDIWNYLPRIDRTIKIPTSMMMASWMGSHFTNDDLVKESRWARDYEAEITFEGERDGVAVWEIRMTPVPDAAVVWGHIELEVRQSDLLPTRARYYGDDGALKRTMTFLEPREFSGRVVPSVLRMRPEDEPGEFTEIRYEKLEFNVEIDDARFSLAALRRGT